MCIIGFIFLLLLTNTIFNVQVIHNDKDVRTLLINELEEYNIKKYSLVKSFDYVEKVKNDILIKYKDKIEWLEIERIGVNYFVRLELRKIPEIKKQYTNQHIISSKDAIIKKIEATDGDIVKNVNDYVRKGDIVISGSIMLNENIKGSIKANGKVYGEVWYQTTVDYPLAYKESKKTGNKKQVFVINMFNRRIELFNFNKYKYKDVTSYTLLKNNIIPISFNKEYQIEINKIDKIYTEDEAIKEAVNLARSKIESKLNDNEMIMSEKTLNVQQKDSRIEVEVFFTVYENITDYVEIIE